MAFTKFNVDMNIIAKLDDEPNDVGGLSADMLKAEFDKSGLLTKKFINETLIPEIESRGASNSGITPIEGLDATNVQDAIVELNGKIVDAATGSIPENSITGAKLADNAVSEGKIAAGAVTSAAIADKAVLDKHIASVSASKITGLSVDTASMADKAVTTAKLADKAVTTSKIATGAVTTDKLGANAVIAAKIADGAVSTTFSAIIDTDWTGSEAPYTQVITVSGILASDKPIVDIVLSDDASTAELEKEAWQYIDRITTTANKITVYSTEKTSSAVAIQLLCIRK